MDKETLIQLAEEYGLPCIERQDVVYIVGVEEILVFYKNLGGNTMTNLLKSPVGQIQFLAVNRPVTNSKGIDVYSVRIAYDNVADAEWIAQIADINPNKPVTATSYRGKNKEVKALLATGKTLISAETKFKVELFDREGNTMEEAPMFFQDSIGTAQMIVSPYTKSEKGGTINLVGVVIHSVEGSSENSGIDRETKLAELRALAKG